MRYGPDVLPEIKREALHAAVATLLDDGFEALASDGDLNESTLVWYLPRRLEPHYHEGLYRSMLVAIANVGGQLASTDAPTLRCLADEMALHVIIEQAGAWLESRAELDEGWGDYEDRVFEDVDFELLYEPAWDGIEDPESDVARQEGMANLASQGLVQAVPCRRTGPSLLRRRVAGLAGTTANCSGGPTP